MGGTLGVETAHTHAGTVRYNNNNNNKKLTERGVASASKSKNNSFVGGIVLCFFRLRPRIAQPWGRGSSVALNDCREHQPQLLVTD